MPEAEDVILDAAERVTAAARSLWRRHRPPPAAVGVALEDERRLLAVLVIACFGEDWPILPSDPDPAPSWLVRRFGTVPPWSSVPHGEPATDGVRLLLPRALAATGDAGADRVLLRVMGLVLAARLARGSIEHGPLTGPARDLWWAAEGALGEVAVLHELPGLRRAIDHARGLALVRRPPERTLRPPEAAVERVVRRLLHDDPLSGVGLSPGLAPAAVAAWARATADGFGGALGQYRGLVPVLHWGRARPDLVAAARAAEASGGSPQRRGERGPARWRRLARRLRPRRDPQDGGSRVGPFALPFGDPPQTVQDAAGLRRPPDRGADVDLEVLAEELERLRQLPRVRADTPVEEVLESDERAPERGATAGTSLPGKGVLWSDGAAELLALAEHLAAGIVPRGSWGRQGSRGAKVR